MIVIDSSLERGCPRARSLAVIEGDFRSGDGAGATCRDGDARDEDGFSGDEVAMIEDCGDPFSCAALAVCFDRPSTSMGAGLSAAPAAAASTYENGCAAGNERFVGFP